MTDFDTFFSLVDNFIIIIIQLEAGISLKKILETYFMIKAAFLSAQIIAPDTVLAFIREEKIICNVFSEHNTASIEKNHIVFRPEMIHPAYL